MLLTEHMDCSPLLQMYVAINHVITALLFSQCIAKFHCNIILFMCKPFIQSAYMHHVS